MIYLKNSKEIEIMRVAGAITAEILYEVAQFAKPGVTTFELDEKAENLCKKKKVIPAFKGYHGFPACLCVSVNEEVVHGIPSKKKILKEGDIVGIDFGVIYEGYYGDSAVTVPIGKVSEQANRLVNATKEALYKGIEQAIIGNRLFDISNAIQTYVEEQGYSVVREFVGHGIGRALHEDPQVPNFGPKGKGIPLKEGMVLAIEPMINIGTHSVKVLNDGWTAVTADGELSAHFEHTIVITKNGPDILTKI
jgi:methionyl aminopeptidase